MTADLRDLFDQAGRNAPVPTLDADAVLRRARRSRQRRIGMRAAAVGVAAAAAVVAVFAVGSLHQAGPLPPTHPSPSGSLFTLDDDPFLTPVDINYWRVVRQDTPAGPRLSDCLSDPRTWGATQGGAQTYVDPHQPALVINEFVLRYDDEASAHRAVLDAADQLMTCTSPREVAIDPVEIQDLSDGEARDNVPNLAEFLAQERRVFPTAQRTNGTDTWYTVRLIRAGNIVVVIEDTGPDKGPGSNANVTMTVAVIRAVHGFELPALSWCPKTAC